jgi:hypothetical protein
VGHHYVPQKYARGFACLDSPSSIWQHDKKTGEARKVSIKRAAQARNYYDPDVEMLLARAVEAPTNPIIEKLIAKKEIAAAERHRLAVYIATMLLRVPAHRRKAMEGYPEQVADYIARFRAEFLRLARSLPDVDPAIVTKRLAEIDAWAKKYAETPPDNIVDEIRSPWPYRSMVSAIEQMTWRILETTGPQYFITSDNPAFYFGGLGLGTPDSELSFPLSTTHSWHGCWQAAASMLVHMQASQGCVREINRRLASTAERAFYHERAPWLLEILRKADPYLSALHWSKPPRWRDIPPLVSDGQRYVLS